MHLSLEASINRNPSLSIVQQLFSNWFEGLDQLHALRICMLHEHNLLTPIGNSLHPFALFLHPYTKLTNLRPLSVLIFNRLTCKRHRQKQSDNRLMNISSI